MTQRTLLIHVQVDADKYQGQTDEQIMEQMFQGNSLPGGATVEIIRGSMPLIMTLLEHVMEDKRSEILDFKITHP